VALFTQCSDKPVSVSTLADSHGARNKIEAEPSFAMNADAPAVGFARAFLRLSNLPKFRTRCLSRYEATLWRQAGQILCALETLDRRKPQERTRRIWLGSEDQIERE